MAKFQKTYSKLTDLLHISTSLPNNSCTLLHSSTNLSNNPRKLLHSSTNLSNNPRKLLHSSTNLSKNPRKLLHSSTNLSNNPRKLLHSSTNLSKNPRKLHQHVLGKYVLAGNIVMSSGVGIGVIKACLHWGMRMFHAAISPSVFTPVTIARNRCTSVYIPTR